MADIIRYKGYPIGEALDDATVKCFKCRSVMWERWLKLGFHNKYDCKSPLVKLKFDSNKTMKDDSPDED